MRDAMILRGGGFDDSVVLHMEFEVATHAAVGANGLRDRLFALVPRFRLSHIEFGFRHESSRWADRDAVPTVDAGGLCERDVEFGGYANVKSSTRGSDGESVLRVFPTGFHAFVAEDAPAVVSHIQRVVDFDGL